MVCSTGFLAGGRFVTRPLTAFVAVALLAVALFAVLAVRVAVAVFFAVGRFLASAPLDATLIVAGLRLRPPAADRRVFLTPLIPGSRLQSGVTTVASFREIFGSPT